MTEQEKPSLTSLVQFLKVEKIAFVDVESSSIAAIGHFGTTLKVKFKNGATYVYENVTAELHKAIVEADSIGSFFAATIKKHPALYPFKKVD